MATSLIGVFLGILFGWNLTNTAKELGKPEQGAKEKRAPQKQGTLRGVLLHFWTSNSSETFATDKRHWSCFVCVLLCVFFYHEINCWVFKVEPSRWLSSNKNHDYFRINVFRPSDHPHVSCWRPSRSLHRPPESTWKDFQKLHVSLKNDFPFSGEAFFTSLEEFWAISCDRWRCKFEESSDSCEVKTLPFDSSKVWSPSHIPHHPTQCVCVCVWTQMPGLQAIGTSLHAFRSHWSTPGAQAIGSTTRRWYELIYLVVFSNPFGKICRTSNWIMKTQGSGWK